MYTGKTSIEPKSYNTLATRIDYEWSIYIDQDSDSLQKENAQDFLVYAFDIRDKDGEEIKAQLDSLMHARNAWKAKNPDYIPGKNPNHLDLSPSELVIKKTTNYNLTPEIRHKQLLNSKELLDVYENFKEVDNEFGTTFLSSEERNRYRVLISEGLFKKHRNNFDTGKFITHGREGFASCVLTSNGELLIFNHLAGERTPNKHLLLYHSSMNGGAPVVFAGEIQIVNGCLKTIMPYSGHYKPSLWNVYRFLHYLSTQDVDLSGAEILTKHNPSNHLGIFTKETYKIHGFTYSTSAKALYESIALTPAKILNQAYAWLLEYEDSNFWFYVKDFFLNSKLTSEREKLAQEFHGYLLKFEKTVAKITTIYQLDEVIELLDQQLQIIEQKNNALSGREGKEIDSGRLAENLSFFRKNMQEMKKGTPCENAQVLKKLY